MLRGLLLAGMVPHHPEKAEHHPMTHGSQPARYPYEPLARHVATRIGLPYCPNPVGCSDCTAGVHAAPRLIADYLGVTNDRIRAWRAVGGVPELAADRVLIAVDSHPALVWPEMYALAGV